MKPVSGKKSRGYRASKVVKFKQSYNNGHKGKQDENCVAQRLFDEETSE